MIADRNIEEFEELESMTLDEEEERDAEEYYRNNPHLDITNEQIYQNLNDNPLE